MNDQTKRREDLQYLHLEIRLAMRAQSRGRSQQELIYKMRRLPRDLVKAYFETDYVLDLGTHPCVIRVDDPVPQALCDFMESRQVDTWTVISAYNPYSQKLSVADNQRRHNGLQMLLTELHYEFHPAVGRSKSGDWEEPSLLVFGLSFNMTRALATLFKQNAVLFGERGAEVEMVFSDREYDSSTSDMQSCERSPAIIENPVQDGENTIPRSPEKFEILQMHLPDGWSCIGNLTLGSNGTCSFELYRMRYKGADKQAIPYLHSLCDFTSGDELFRFVRLAWYRENLNGLTKEQWIKVVQVLQQVDTTIAGAVENAVSGEFYGLDEELNFEVPSAAELWARRAVWEREKFGPGGGAQWAAIGEQLRSNSAVRFYIYRHLHIFGKLPKGTHNLVVRFGALEEGADCRPPSFASQPTVFEREVRFPTS